MTQETAVEWLIWKQLDAGIGLPKGWREQAKAMEKEQIMEAYIDGYEEAQRYGETSSEDYYKQKYTK